MFVNPLPVKFIFCCGNKVCPKTADAKTAVPNTAGLAKDPIDNSVGCGTLLSSKSYLHKTFKLSLAPSARILVLI